jgi:excisionase family DNA binding protein
MHKRSGASELIAIEAKVLVSMEEAAAMLSLGRTVVYELVRRRELCSVKVGRNRRVVAASLHEYVGRLLAQAS